jgi:pimeloyl-ACP methyl ester carboxylesterase
VTTTDVPTNPADDGIARAQVNGIEIAYETFGDPGDPAILLVMGLGTQMLAWPDQMCEALAAAGHHVIRFDNRDVGLSTHFHDAPAPAPHEVLLKRRAAPYSVSDMSDDAVGLLDHLGVEKAHVVGASMGGFISQTIALEHPHRVLSLTLIMTSTGSRRVGRPTPQLIARMARRPIADSREAAMEESVATYRLTGSPDHLDEELVRELAGRAYDRAYDPMGTQRQLAAILSQPDRTRRLASLSVPTLVVHGLDDPLVAASGGLAIAKAIPGATFIGHSGMGHDLPRTLWRTLTDDILGLVDRVDAEPQHGTPSWRSRAAS